ncbi:hypothetical protein C8R44DRAFT_776293 [Mycena epipterygia]|nr:hypothetical protein C8R44DRAFT_776293 [Mycena epipterygia]
MSSSASSSSSSSSSSSRSSTPEPATKRKREAENSDSESDSEDDSDAEAAPDVPVLSHAEQRRQKRKEKQEKSEQPAKKRKLPDGSAATTPSKRQNSVWVGNLTFKTTTEALTEFFKDVGEITRIHMPTKPSTAPGVKAENRGYAYVDFTTAEAKKAAIAMSEQNLFGRKLLIKDGDDFTGRPAAPGVEAAANGSEPPKTHSKTAQKILRAQKQPPAPTLFLGNLGFETTDISIRGLFEAHRPIKKKAKTEDGTSEEKPEADKEKWIRKVRMGTFEDSGLCKGFAFVDFTSIEHATSVLINPKNHTLDGRKLVVEYASADAVRRGAPKTKREDGGADRMPQRRKEAKSRGPRAEKKLEREKQAEDGGVTFSAPRSGGRPSYDRVAPSHDAESGGGGRERKGPKNRPKPGAALALAKRESAAIVPSQGKKVVF